jgi:hypothetical protein
MPERKYEIYSNIGMPKLIYLDEYIQPDECITRVKIKGLLPECRYEFKFNVHREVISNSRFSQEYECKRVTKMYLFKNCDCVFREIIKIICYCSVETGS